MTSSDARNLAFELWKLLRAGERFRNLRRRYDIVRSLRDGGGASSSDYARRHRWVMRLGGTLNRARVVLDERIRICRQKVNGLAAGPHAGEPWRTDARRRLAPALTDLTDAIQRTLEVHPESGAGPTHAEILGALERHETDIRECGQFLSDVAAEVRAAAVSAALDRYPTLLTGLIYLARSDDGRWIGDPKPKHYTIPVPVGGLSTAAVERARVRWRDEGIPTHIVGKPFAFAMAWVHIRCTWQPRRNGAELWDYVGQSARGGIVDADVREAVVPQLSQLDTSETRRALWAEVLWKFPHIASDLLTSTPACPVDDLLTFLNQHDPDIDERAARIFGRPPRRGEVSIGMKWYRHARDMASSILERNPPFPPLPSRADDPADGLRDLRQWCINAMRALQHLSDSGDKPAPGVEKTRQQSATETDWRDVQRQLLVLCDQGEAYTNLRDLMKRTRCRSTSTVSKAIKRSTTLMAWQARHKNPKGPGRARGLTGFVLDNTKQTRELDPSRAAEMSDDDDTIFNHLIQDAKTPEERAELHAMPPEKRAAVIATVRSDPDRGNRLLGRRP